MGLFLENPETVQASQLPLYLKKRDQFFSENVREDQRMVVAQMAFWTQNVIGTFQKRAFGSDHPIILRCLICLLSLFHHIFEMSLFDSDCSVHNDGSVHTSDAETNASKYMCELSKRDFRMTLKTSVCQD